MEISSYTNYYQNTLYYERTTQNTVLETTIKTDE